MMTSFFGLPLKVIHPSHRMRPSEICEMPTLGIPPTSLVLPHLFSPALIISGVPSLRIQSSSPVTPHILPFLSSLLFTVSTPNYKLKPHVVNKGKQTATHSRSCPGNPMDRGAWRAMVHGVPKS